MNLRLQLLRQRLGEPAHGRTSLPKRPDAETAPLSAAQSRMWLHQNLNPASSAYNVCIRMDLTGALEEDKLIAALQAVVARHEVLRTTYPAGPDGKPYQRIHQALPPSIAVLDEGEPQEIARRLARQPFDLAQSGPLRAAILRPKCPTGRSATPQTWVLTISVHHIVWDGGCFGIFSRDLSLAYQGLAASPLEVQVADIAFQEQQQEIKASANLTAQLDYWRKALSPLPPVLPLPMQHLPGPQTDEHAERLDRVMPPACATGLRAAATALRSTPFAVFMAAYALLLNRWTGVSDITIGTMVANRHVPGSGDLIGNFGNTVLLRLDLSNKANFRALVAHATEVISGALSHGEISFEALVSDLQPPREAGHGFFTDTLGLFLDRDIQGPQLPGTNVTWENIFNHASPFALTFQGFLTGEKLQVEATYKTALFSSAVIDSMLQHLEAILMRAIEQPEAALAAVARLPANQSDRLATLSAGAEVDLSGLLVLERWRHHVAGRGSDVALVHNGQTFTYGTLEARINRLAASMMERGLKPQDVVAVSVTRSPVTLIAPLAIWKCGAIFLPLDPTHPETRRDGLMREAGARLLIADAPLSDNTIATVLTSEILAGDGTEHPDSGHRPAPLETAYIGFTSGSTGRPKAVCISHLALQGRTVWAPAVFPGGKGGKRLAKTAPTAIDAIAEVCEAIVTGEALVLATDAEARDAVALAGLLKTHGIGHMMAVPGLIEAAAIAAPDSLSQADRIISTGEPLLPGTATAVYRAAAGVPLHNSYGCTETTGDVAFGPVSVADVEQGTAPIGTPLPGSRCHILGADLQPMPPGALGELYVESPQLTTGYLNQTGLTASRFIANPFGEGSRLYRTGDLARWRQDGRLELAGRADDQVNIRGHRVEPGEVVKHLLSLPAVREAAVVARTAGSSTELIAYVSGDGLGEADGVSLRETLAQSLPGPLVPAEVVVLAALPRLPGGKIDKQRLQKEYGAKDQGAKIATAKRAPASEQERVLTALLGELLRRDDIGPEDNFFALGGDSLLAVSFAARAHAAGVSFPAAGIFQHPTIAQIAARWPAKAAEPAKAEATRTEPTRTAQLSPQVHRFRLSNLNPTSFVTWQVLGKRMEAAALQKALAETVDRTASLQLALSMRGRLWRAEQASAKPEVLTVETDDLAELLAKAQTGLDLTKGRGIVGVITPARTLLVAHAALIDGLSLQRLGRLIEGKAPIDPQAPHTDTTQALDWQTLLDQGAESPWWIGPDHALQAGPVTRLTLRMKKNLPAEGVVQRVTRSALAALARFGERDFIIADVEVEPETPGPLVSMPMALRASQPLIWPDPSHYLAFLTQRRPVAGGPGVLLRRSLADGEADAALSSGTEPPRGADRLYHLVLGWQAEDGTVRLEARSADAALAEAALTAWREEISYLI
ncbi:non-ribosomal peptide synthetase [Rhizobium paknamense]|uniref:Amino acid adenylation domain-containing protein n=1 Tax=Rhizobium paknamense TaxID=1206817 RepID=A0ABU0IHP4_9HYPH|nr:amino acid adenylation domain-containing protein [Rhizobium paknamense]MDQ0457780.1 amino acid adenylation domain-containing protein [Rhizobium paknamense]